MGLINKIWNGEVPLVKVYWIYGVLVGIFWRVLFEFIGTDSFSIFAFTAFIFVYQIILNVAVWRSATNYNGPKVWSVLAKILVTVGTILLLIIIAGLYNSNFSNHQSETVDKKNTTFNSDDKSSKSDKPYVYKESNNTVWEPLRTKAVEGLWIDKNSIKKNEYGIASAWLKVKLIDLAKKKGEDYRYSITKFNYSCNDNTFRFSETKDIFNIETGLIDFPTNDLVQNKWEKVNKDNMWVYETFGFICKN